MQKVCAAIALVLLAACNRADAPADKLEQAAEDIAETAGVETPRAPFADGPFAPRDECSDLDGAREFRQRLAAAVEERDTAGLVALAAEDVKLDFGGGKGREELSRRLEADGSDLWEQLDQLMILGCDGDRQKGITMPWYYAQDVPGDPMRMMIVTGESVPVLAQPKADAEIVERLSWEAVPLSRDDQPGQDFRKIDLGDGKSGFVTADRLRSVLDYRLQAISRNGKWSITSIVRGV